MFIFTWFLVPETKGISLEKMDDLFGVVRDGNSKILDIEASEGRGRSISSDKGDVTVSHVEKS